MAADKGFVCVRWNMFEKETMQVANLATGSMLDIPPFNAATSDIGLAKYATGAMTVAEDCSSFTDTYVAHLPSDLRHDPRRPFLRFDSQVAVISTARERRTNPSAESERDALHDVLEPRHR